MISLQHLHVFIHTEPLSICYAQALGVVVVGFLSVELLGRIKTRSGRPSYHASQGQNRSVTRGCRDSGEVRQWA